MTTPQIFQIGYVAIVAFLLIIDWYASKAGKV